MTTNIPACHDFIRITYPALDLALDYPTNIPNFVPLAYRWHEVGPGAMKVGTCGYGKCAVCGQGIWFSSMYHAGTNSLEFREHDITTESFEQMNTVT